MRGIAVLWLSVGCSWIPPEEQEEVAHDPREVSVDEALDDDGIPEGDDCEDADGPEIPSDGIDNDCDGHVDCEDPDLVREVVPPYGEWTDATLSALCADDDCVSMGSSLTISESDLVDLEFLSCLVSVEGLLTIGDNYLLTSLHGLEGLTRVGGLDISNNKQLSTLEPLGRLTQLDDRLLVARNESLTTLTGLEGLETVGGIEISSNAALTALSGLDKVTRIDRSLLIEDNPQLTDVGALYDLESVRGDVTITDNVALGNAAAWDLVEAIDTIGGDVTVSGNR